MIPFEERWLSIGEVAELLGVKPRTAAKYVTLPGFPPALRIGHPRWRCKEVVAWAEQNQLAA